MPLILNNAPTSYPVSKELAKQWLKQDEIDEDDPIIDLVIKSAVDWAENFTARRFISQTWTQYRDNFPSRCENSQWWPGAMLIPYPPLSSVTHIKYYDTQGTLQTLSSSDYSVDAASEPGRITPAPNLVWPSVQSDRINAVEIKFVCGYANAAAVPPALTQALLFLIENFYDRRDELVIGASVISIPIGIESCLWPFRDLRNL